jgi:hypothetical protein
MALVSGTLLGSLTIRRFAVKKFWLLKLLTGVAFLSFYLPEVYEKLPLLGFGISCDILSNYGLWISSTQDRRERGILGNLLGLLAYISVKMGFRALDPIWMYTEANIAALVFTVLCSLYYLVKVLH